MAKMCLFLRSRTAAVNPDIGGNADQFARMDSKSIALA